MLVFIEIKHKLKEITLPFNHFNVEQHKDLENLENDLNIGHLCLAEST